MSYLAHAQAMADPDALVMTHELASRPARAPDHAAENRALAELAQELARHPEAVPGRVEDLLRALCRCGAAGTGLPDQHHGGVDWRTAGSEPVLLRDPARLFPSLRTAGRRRPRCCCCHGPSTADRPACSGWPIRNAVSTWRTHACCAACPASPRRPCALPARRQGAPQPSASCMQAMRSWTRPCTPKR